MNKIKFALLIILMAMLNMHAYTQKNLWIVKAGESIKEVLGDSNLYHYPQFISGIVYYKNGTMSKAPLNFNLITGEMQFISSANDTLTVANEETINYVTIQSDTFYFDKVFIELTHSNAAAKLGKVEMIKLTDVQKEGAFGQMSSTASIDVVDSYYGSNQTYKLAEKSNVTLRKRTIFFIGDNNNHFLPASKKNVSKLFSKNSAVEPFIKKNKTAFSQEDDLVALVNFLAKM